MNVTFNILADAWIPVISLDGEKRMLGLCDALNQAHELREISDVSPMVEYSLHRFLSLFLMDALRPESEPDLEDLLEAGRLDMDLIEQYIALCGSEGVTFDLFDETRPFMQSRYDKDIDKEVKPVAVLDCTRASGNNHAHFDHGGEKDRVLPPDEAFRLLLSTYLFCTAGAQEYPSSVYGAPPYFCVIKGKNLFETLVYSLLPTDSIGIDFDDPPVFWRRTEPITKTKVGKTSWLLGMLFPTRRILLLQDENGAVRGVYLSQGENYVNKESWRDPYVTYRKGKEKYVPVHPSADFAVWRNMNDLINVSGGNAPQFLSQFRSIGYSERNVNVVLYGVETSQASYLAEYRHDLSFPARLIGDERGIELLSACISACERIAKELQKALSDITIGENRMFKSQIINAVQKYYQKCENAFWKVCNADGENENRKEIYQAFCEEIALSAVEIFNMILSGSNLRASALCSAEKAHINLKRAIHKIRKEASL